MAASSISFDRLLSNISNEILNPILWILFALATLYFLYGVFEFVRDAGNPEGRKTGGQHIMWGLIGMFIMFSVIGIINLILGTIGIF